MKKVFLILISSVTILFVLGCRAPQPSEEPVREEIIEEKTERRVGPYEPAPPVR